MNKAHNSINWENYPSDATPLNEQNLNKMDSSIDVIDDRVVLLDSSKASREELMTLIENVSFNESNGVFTVTRKNGSVFTIDTKIEKIAINFDYDPILQQIVLSLIDGTRYNIDLSALITQYEFLDSDTVSFIIGEDGKVSAIVKEGSIEEKHLRPNYLAEIKIEVEKAIASERNAATSEANAAISAESAASSAVAAAASENIVASSAVAAAASEANAAISAESAASSAVAAAASEEVAEEMALSASESKITSSEKANIAIQKAEEIVGQAESAEESATKSKSYAVGGTGSREREDSDNAMFYYQQTRNISESFAGALRPMGTVLFEEIPPIATSASGDMYNISNQFTTTEEFREGFGNVISAGANIYKTADGKWDVLAGTPVTGVKGSTESIYRRGNVNVTAENVGALPLTGGTLSGNIEVITPTYAKISINAPNTGYSAALEAGADRSCLSFGNSSGWKNVIDYFEDGNAYFTGKLSWDNVTGKPDNYPPSNHAHNYAGSSSAGGAAYDAISSNQLQAFTEDNFTGGNHFVKAIRSANGWGTHLYMCYYGGAKQADAVSVNYANSAGSATSDSAGYNIHETFNQIINMFGGYLPTSASCNKNWNWSGQGGQPTWLWGGEDGKNMYVYNPANFSVNYATYSGSILHNGANAKLSFNSSRELKAYDTAGNNLDNACNLGTGGARWKQLYAATATISTSDRNLKKDIAELTDNHLKFFLMLIPVSYHFVDGESGRTHIGFIAQDVEDAMEKCGITALDFAGFCKDAKTVVCWEKDENGNKIEKECPVLNADGNPEYIYSLRYEEFIALVTYATQNLYSRVDALENRLEQMEKVVNSIENTYV